MTDDLVTPEEHAADRARRAARDAERAAKREARPRGRRNLARAGKRVERVIRGRLEAIGLRARRVPGSGSIEGTEDSDVLHWTDTLGKTELEVKARADSKWKVLDGWLGGADVLVLWLFGKPGEARVFMPLTTYERMLAALVAYESQASESEDV